ncbi:MAG TPA: hypothetical protein DCM30_12670 [Acinetobacter radioresistens]|nr:hypothetical protein [Acinetobacter radioresistens]
MCKRQGTLFVIRSIFYIKHRMLKHKIFNVFSQFIGGMCQKNQSNLEFMLRYNTQLYLKKMAILLFIY